MLTRDYILSGEFHRAHELTLPGHMIWDREKITESMLTTLKERPSGAPVWIFAYGSLMWRRCVKQLFLAGSAVFVSVSSPAELSRKNLAACYLWIKTEMPWGLHSDCLTADLRKSFCWSGSAK